MNLTVTSGAIQTIPSVPSSKRRIVQNVGAGAVYWHHDASLTEAQIIAQGLLLPSGAALGFDERENNCGYVMVLATPTSSEIRYLDVL